MERKFLLAVMSLVIGCSVACAKQPATEEDKAAEAVVEALPQGDTVAVMSHVMDRAIKNTVIVPRAYYADTTRRWPVVYLLHGADGCYSDWPRKANLDSLANRYEVIIVCPDGQDSWYFDSPIDPTMQFETYVGTELVNWIDEHYRTIDSPKGRAITGLSMGGHGALWIGWRHPDTFGQTGSMSGGVNITKFPDRWLIQRMLGKYSANPKRWADHAVVNLVPTLKAGRQRITIDDGESDFFLEVNNELHAALLKAKIPHDYTIRPGGHSWNYWVNSLDYHLLFFQKGFK